MTELEWPSLIRINTRTHPQAVVVIPRRRCPACGNEHVPHLDHWPDKRCKRCREIDARAA